MSRIETMKAAAEDSSHWWWRDSNAPADLRDLLAAAEAARLVSTALAEFGAYYVVDGRSVRHELDAALARLDAVTGGETS